MNLSTNSHNYQMRLELFSFYSKNFSKLPAMRDPKRGQVSQRGGTLCDILSQFNLIAFLRFGFNGLFNSLSYRKNYRFSVDSTKWIDL